MWEQILEAAANSGLWAMLFVTLFVIQLKDSKEREGKYQETIASLGDKLKVVAEIKAPVDTIREKIESGTAPKSSVTTQAEKYE